MLLRNVDGEGMGFVKRSWLLGAAVVLVAVLVAGCGGSKKSSSSNNGTTKAGAAGGTLITLANAAPSGSPDPQVNYTLQEWQFLILTHDGLVGFKRVGGPAGNTIVPDLATTMPTVSKDGLTYKFTLRTGIKFSNGQTVTPADVKATFVRLFKIGDSPNAGVWYNAIQGGDACVKTPKSCNLDQGITISGNDVTFHLAHADPEFLDQLALPFAAVLPASTPAHNLNIPPAGTGPYKWVEYAPNKEMKVVRNPFFKVWSVDAQPAALPDSIVQKFGLSVESEVTQVENGNADFIANSDTIPADRLSEISTKYPSQVHINSLYATYYFAFNTRIPPFNNLKARQAVNYATDRNALVRIEGGPKINQVTCQILPPGFPGYVRYCPYTTNPSSTGAWNGPDMAKAQQLIAASGTKGMPVKVNSDTTDVDKALALYFVSLLNKLGYKATPQLLSNAIQYPYVQNSKNKVPFAFSSWYDDYPAASDFLNILLGCPSFHPNSNSSPNIAEFCNRSIQAQMSHAEAVGVRSLQQANNIWTKVDHEMVDQAVWDPVVNPKQLNFVSKRVHGFQWSPQWYFLLAQASVK